MSEDDAELSLAFPVRKLIEDLEAAAGALSTGNEFVDELPKADRRRLERAVERLMARLPEIAAALDPFLSPEVLDPSDPHVAARFLSEQLDRVGPYPLGAIPPFWGAGV